MDWWTALTCLYLIVTVKKQQSPKPVLEDRLRTFHFTVPVHVYDCPNNAGWQAPLDKERNG